MKSLFNNMFRFYKDGIIGNGSSSMDGDNVDERALDLVDLGDELEEKDEGEFGNEVTKKQREEEENVVDGSTVEEVLPHKPKQGGQLFSREGQVNEKWKEEKKGLLREVEHFKKILREQEAGIEAQKNEIVDEAQQTIDHLNLRLTHARDVLKNVRKEYEEKIAGLKTFTKKVKASHEKEKVELASEVQSLQEKRKIEKEERSNFEKNLSEEMKRQKDVFEDQRKKFEERVGDLESTIRENEEESKKIVMEREELELKLSKLERMYQRKVESEEQLLKDHEEKIEEMMTENFELKSKISSLEKQVTSFRSENSKSDGDSMKHLQSKIDKLETEKLMISTEYEEKIMDMQQKHEKELKEKDGGGNVEKEKILKEFEHKIEKMKSEYEKKIAEKENLLGRTKMLSKNHIANIKSKSTNAYQRLQTKMKELSVAAKNGLTEKINTIERLQNELNLKNKELSVMKSDLSSLSGNEMLERQLKTYIEKEKTWEAEREKLVGGNREKKLTEKQNEIRSLTVQMKEKSKRIAKLDTEVNMLKQFHHKKEQAWKKEKKILREWMKKKVSSPSINTSSPLGSPAPGTPNSPENRFRNLFGKGEERE